MDGNVKFACSYCGVPRFYPAEMEYTAERMFRCYRHDRETTTNLEEARKHNQMPRPMGDMPRFQVGVPAEWQLAQAEQTDSGEDIMPTGAGTVNGTTAVVSNLIGSLSASKVDTGVYLVTIPPALALSGLVVLVSPATPSPYPGAIPIIDTHEIIDTRTVRINLHTRVGSATDTNFNIAIWAV